MEPSKKRILVAMSGGVDSAVAASLLCEAGYDCVGCTMKMYHPDELGVSEGACGSADDVDEAKKIAEALGISHHVLDCSCDFKEKIIGKFVASYQVGETPNPCIDCNRYMKFDRLLRFAHECGCKDIATGHYARIIEENGEHHLYKATDPSKDQSYVLYHITEDRLSHTHFPLGGLSKQQVREMAAARGFSNAQKPDSQDICFVPDGDYARVVEHALGKSAVAGDFVDQNGNVLGRHKGVIHYTVGQRRGLGIAAPQPYYVCRVEPEQNLVVLGKSQDLFSKNLYAGDFVWINGMPKETEFDCAAKIRYRQTEQPAHVTVLDEKTVKVEFYEAQRAITPGQAVVLYLGDRILGGGKILK